MYANALITLDRQHRITYTTNENDLEMIFREQVEA
jgi:hypothetical protein